MFEFRNRQNKINETGQQFKWHMSAHVANDRAKKPHQLDADRGRSGVGCFIQCFWVCVKRSSEKPSFPHSAGPNIKLLKIRYYDINNRAYRRGVSAREQKRKGKPNRQLALKTVSKE